MTQNTNLKTISGETQNYYLFKTILQKSIISRDSISLKTVKRITNRCASVCVSRWVFVDTYISLSAQTRNHSLLLTTSDPSQFSTDNTFKQHQFGACPQQWGNCSPLGQLLQLLKNRLYLTITQYWGVGPPLFPQLHAALWFITKEIYKTVKRLPLLARAGASLTGQSNTPSTTRVQHTIAATTTWAWQCLRALVASCMGRLGRVHCKNWTCYLTSQYYLSITGSPIHRPYANKLKLVCTVTNLYCSETYKECLVTQEYRSLAICYSSAHRSWNKYRWECRQSKKECLLPQEYKSLAVCYSSAKRS